MLSLLFQYKLHIQGIINNETKYGNKDSGTKLKNYYNYKGTSLTLTVIYFTVYFIFHNSIFHSYMNLKKIISGEIGILVIDNNEFLIILFILLVFIDILPIAISAIINMIKYRRKLQTDKYAQTQYLLYGPNKSSIAFIIGAIISAGIIFYFITSYTSFDKNNIKTYNIISQNKTYSYNKIKAIYCDQEWIYKSTKSVITLTIEDNANTIDIGNSFIKDISLIKYIIEKNQLKAKRTVTKNFLEYSDLNDNEEKFYKTYFIIK